MGKIGSSEKWQRSQTVLLTNYLTLRYMSRGQFTVVILLFFVSCTGGKKPQLMVASASNLRSVMPQLISEFRSQNPEVEMEVVYASSGKLAAEIETAHAPYDLFLSANEVFTKHLQKKALIESPTVFAQGNLAVICTDSQYLSPDTWFEQADFRLAIANPKVAPFGKAAADYLKQFRPTVDSNDQRIVLANNVQQVNHYLKAGAIQVGLTTASVKEVWPDVFLRKISGKSNEKLLQTACIVNTENKWADKFVEFLLSNTCQKILEGAGYNMVSNE